MKGKLLFGSRLKNKLFQILAIIALLCLTPMFVLWASAQTPPTLEFEFIATGANFSARTRNCLQAQSGTIVADLPDPPYEDENFKIIGGVSWKATYSYNEKLPLPLDLVEDITVHIHIDGTFRRLEENVPADIIMLMIGGCTARPDLTGVQYCVNWGTSSELGNIGTVTRKGDTWYIDAEFLTSEQEPPSLCVNDWLEGEVMDGFCIPLRGFRVVVKGTITN